MDRLRKILSPAINTEKRDSKKRKVFRDSKGRTYVIQDDKKVYVKKLFTPTRNSSPVKNTPAKSPVINTGKVNAKKRRVFKDSKGRAYVKQGDKKVYVKKLFTPMRNSSPMINTPAKSPMINTGKVNAKKRRVFKDSKGRTYVKQGDKKVYVKKLFTPMRNSSPVKNTPMSPGINIESVDSQKRRIFKDSKGLYVMQNGKRVYGVKEMFTPPRIVSPVRSPKRQTTPAKGCGTSRGLGQVTNTCWFNSPLNGFILAEGTSKMILEQISELSPTNVISLSKSFPEGSCPLTLSKKYIYHYFMKIHSKQPIVGRSQNVSVNLIGKLFTPKRLSSPTANGRQGGQTGIAALQIMKILFGNDNIVYLPEWQNFVPNGIGNRRILYRFGPPSGEYRTLHSQPMFMNSRDGETRFELSHMVYTVSISVGPHAVVAYMCGNKRYIYDANKSKNLEVDWSNPKNIKKILKYSDASEVKYVTYTLYVRK